MEGAQHSDSDEDHCAVEDEEERLVLHKGAAPAGRYLGDSEVEVLA